jgi:glucose-6-phosphate dehydrogenase assembly protein OpcA
MGAALSPDRILRELADLWAGMAKPGTDEGEGTGVLRACSMTLVVLAEESEDMSALGETLAALMPEHPARAILIRLRADGPRALSERVYAQCWRPFGQRRQVCCDQVEIAASDAALADLPAVVLPLAVADLPVILWCRATRILGMPEFRSIAAMATRVIVDSAAWTDAGDALRRLAAASDQTRIGDLAWTRLTRPREILAQVFENRERLAQIASIGEVSVRFGPRYETGARYMAAWVADRLAAASAKPRVVVEPDAGTPTLQMELRGEGLRIALRREAQRLVVSVNEIEHCTNLPQPGDYTLMREELGIVRRDPVFEATLSSAARLAYPTQ